MTPPDVPVREGRTPAFNVPVVVVALLAVMAVVHLWRDTLPVEEAVDFLLRFSFVPARYDADLAGVLPGGTAAGVWTPLTYAFLHGDWSHYLMNALWMLVFGSALAWRFSAARFLVFSGICAVAGALTHLLFYPGAPVPLVGASAALSGQMAGALRFVFQRGGPLDRFSGDGQYRYYVPAASIADMARTPAVCAFVLIWLVFNVVYGFGFLGLSGDADVAWQAHIGGFVAGLLLFRLFDPWRHVVSRA